jgi:hypothetical protein
VKFGRNRPVAIGPHFRLRNYLRASLPTPPPTADFSAPAQAVLANVYGNDELGDCVIAAGYHMAGVVTGNADALFTATPAQILADYSAIGGYVPGNASTDQGCDEVTALNYWTQHGFANGVKLLGWLTGDATNKVEVMTAISLFEGIYLTLELPTAYVSPFPSGNGFVWKPGAPNPQNGHAIMADGYDAAGVTIWTWGMRGTLTWAALAELCTLAAGGGFYLSLSPNMLARGAAKAPNGFAWADLVADFDTMGGSVPVPAPVPVPSPTPGGPVTLAQAQAWVRAGITAGHPLQTRLTAETLAAAALAAHWPAP